MSTRLFSLSNRQLSEPDLQTCQVVDDAVVGDLKDTRLAFFPEPGGKVNRGKRRVLT